MQGRVAVPKEQPEPYSLPRGRRKRRSAPEPAVPARQDNTAAIEAPASEAKEASAEAEPASALRLVNGVRWERESRGARVSGHERGFAEPTATLGPDIFVFGRVECGGHLDLNGIVEGEVLCKSVSIGPTGQVYGSIVAECAWIGGAIEGPVTAHSVTLAKTARVIGSIFHRDLYVEPGAKHKGRKPWRLNPLENR